MLKMSKIDQIHLKGCNAMYVEDIEDGKRTSCILMGLVVECSSLSSVHGFFAFTQCKLPPGRGFYSHPKLGLVL